MSSTALQSLNHLKWLLKRYKYSFSIAHTTASASLSVWEYHLSTAMRAQLTYATTHLSPAPGMVCMRMADKPERDGSVTNSVSLFGSRYAIISVLVSNFSIVLKEFCCSLHHRKGWFFLVNFRNGSEISLKFGINLAQYMAIPKKLLTACMIVGGSPLSTDSTLTGSGKIPFSENTNPKNEILHLLNSHFLTAGVASKLPKTCSCAADSYANSRLVDGCRVIWLP